MWRDGHIAWDAACCTCDPVPAECVDCDEGTLPTYWQLDISGITYGNAQCANLNDTFILAPNADLSCAWIYWFDPSIPVDRTIGPPWTTYWTAIWLEKFGSSFLVRICSSDHACMCGGCNGWFWLWADSGDMSDCGEGGPFDGLVGPQLFLGPSDLTFLDGGNCTCTSMSVTLTPIGPYY